MSRRPSPSPSPRVEEMALHAQVGQPQDRQREQPQRAVVALAVGAAVGVQRPVGHGAPVRAAQLLGSGASREHDRPPQAPHGVLFDSTTTTWYGAGVPRPRRFSTSRRGLRAISSRDLSDHPSGDSAVRLPHRLPADERQAAVRPPFPLLTVTFWSRPGPRTIGDQLIATRPAAQLLHNRPADQKKSLRLEAFRAMPEEGLEPPTRGL